MEVVDILIGAIGVLVILLVIAYFLIAQLRSELRDLRDTIDQPITLREAKS